MDKVFFKSLKRWVEDGDNVFIGPRFTSSPTSGMRAAGEGGRGIEVGFGVNSRALVYVMSCMIGFALGVREGIKCD